MDKKKLRIKLVNVWAANLLCSSLVHLEDRGSLAYMSLVVVES